MQNKQVSRDRAGSERPAGGCASRSRPGVATRPEECACAYRFSWLRCETIREVNRWFARQKCSRTLMCGSQLATSHLFLTLFPNHDVHDRSPGTNMSASPGHPSVPLCSCYRQICFVQRCVYDSTGRARRRARHCLKHELRNNVQKLKNKRAVDRELRLRMLGSSPVVCSGPLRTSTM